MSALHDTLAAFAHRVRDPHHAPVPPGISPRGMAVYSEIVFNNVSGFPDACFPVCRQVLGEARWTRLKKRFIREWPCQTPWFREIPREFLAFLLENRDSLRVPRWLPELAHYEWAELAVDVMDTAPSPCLPEGNLLAGTIVTNPALLNLAYQWPVHRIGPEYRPRKPEPTWLVVYRDREEEVQFSLLTPASARLLDILARERLSGEAALARLAGEMGQALTDRFLQFGAGELENFRRLGLILGVAP